MSRNAVLVCCATVGLLATGLCLAAPGTPSFDLKAVPTVITPALDMAVIQAEDAQDEIQGLPPRFAIPLETLLRPSEAGLWEDVDADTVAWRLRVTAPGAPSINLGFTAYSMPIGGELRIYAVDGSYKLEPYTSAHNSDEGQLWTAVVLSDDIVVEARLPRSVADQLVLELTSINVGYRYFGAMIPDKAGACEIDVICPIADPWRNEIPAIATYTTGGSRVCTGFMVNNTSQNQTPYFQSAHHCGITSGNAASMVIYWNYQSPTCGQHGGGSLSQNQTGATMRADYSTSDFTLVQLNAAPNPTYKITFAGWDRRDVNATSIVGIHHPNTDEKSISFAPNASFVSTYLSDTSPGDGTHLRVIWLPVASNQGVTEPGSSGSPLFDQNHHVLGQLHGGYSACGASDMRDWYGRVYRSWTGGGTSATRLSDWLDPGSTGANTTDTYNPYANGISVSPGTNFDSTGDGGGPFTPGSIVYTIKNNGTTTLNYSVTKTQAWVTLTGSVTGTLVGGAQTSITVSINATANTFDNGNYTDTVTFTNTTDHVGDTTRAVTLRVGVPHQVYSWPLDTNPGWTTQGSWAWGHPTGGAGDHGGPDPANGHTGSYVYGYNLSGGYTNSMAETNLTTTAINCTGFTQVKLRFWRWLGVERSTYDHAYVRVSNNGSTYNTVWQNSDTTIDDGSWQFQEFDISAYADNKATVYIRWVLGTTDSSWTYCGWNIDDIEIWGVTPQPTGACCPGDGSCSVTRQIVCSGTWQGAGTGCSPNPCSQSQGACCQPDGSCTVTMPAGCTGTWQGADTTCSPNPCPQPSGACCQVDGSCTKTTQDACTGTWQGAETVCDPNPCPQPQGACCQTDGSCSVTTQAACASTWQGAETTCSPNPCPQPQGACCQTGGSCSVTTQAACAGAWQGDGTTCSPNPCPQPGCTGDANCDQSVSWRDIDFFVAAMNDNVSEWSARFLPGTPSCPFSNCDVNGDGYVSWHDIDRFVERMNTTCP